ncbi:MAG: EI24 domain-containing protein [Pirellulales bacterium]|nr:EI24 domain-containing protein [Pirellulales bacterium]
MSTTPTTTGRGFLAELYLGLAAPWRGLSYLQDHPALWRYGMLPVLLNILVTLLVLVGVAASAVAFAVYVHPRFADSVLGWIGEALSIVGLLVATAGVAVVGWLVFGALLTDHFNGLLARRIEISLGTPPEELRELPMLRQIADALWTAFVLLVINAGLLLLNCVPVIGSIVAIPLALSVDGYVFGRDYFDYPLSLRGWPRPRKHGFARQHWPATIGLGVTVLLANLVPILGGVLLTTAVVGAVLMYRDLAPAGGKSRERSRTAPRPTSSSCRAP